MEDDATTLKSTTFCFCVDFSWKILIHEDLTEIRGILPSLCHRSLVRPRRDVFFLIRSERRDSHTRQMQMWLKIQYDNQSFSKKKLNGSCGISVTAQ